MPSDLEIEIANLTKEVNRAKQNIAKMKRVTLGLQKRNQNKLNTATRDLEALQALPPNQRSEARLYFLQLNVEAAKNALEMVEVLEPLLVPDLKNAGKAMKANMSRIDVLGAQARFIGIERQVVTYKDKIRLIQAALEAPAAGGGTGQLKTPTGQLPAAPTAGPTGQLPQRPGMPGAAPGAAGPGARPGIPPRPGAAAPGAPGAAPGAPRPGGPGPLAQRAAQMQQNRPAGTPPAGRTGPLQAGAAGVPRPGTGGTGPLAQRAAARGTGNIENPAATREANIAKIREQLSNPQMASGLQALMAQFTEIDTLLEPLRQGPGPGKIDMPAQQAEVLLNNVAGKIYYMKRTIQALGPIAGILTFEEAKADSATGLEEYLEKMESEGDAPAPAAAAAKPEAQRPTSVMDQLRSILKSTK